MSTFARKSAPAVLPFSPLVIVVSVAALAGILASCAPGSSSVPAAGTERASEAAIPSGKPYLLATEPYPPYEYLDEDGRPAGPDVELLLAAARLAGVELRIEFMPWTRAEAMNRDGSADALFSCNRTPEREDILYFPEIPLAVETNAIIASPDYPPSPRSLPELGDAVVGYVAGNVLGGGFDGNDAVRKFAAADQDELARAFVGGRFPLMANNTLVAARLLRDTPFEGRTRVLFTLSEAGLYIGFSRASPRGAELFAKLAPALAALERSGEAARIRALHRVAP